MQTTTSTRAAYESIEFTLNDGQSNYNLATNQATFLGRYFGINDQPLPTQIRITTNQTISIKLNTTSDHSITITSTDVPYYIKGVQIKNVFLSNSSGSNATVRILLQDVEY